MTAVLPPPLLAHGLGDAGDLPVPLPLLLYGCAGAVLGLAVLVSRRRNIPAPSEPRPLPSVVTTVVDAPVTRALLRVVGAVLLLAALVPAALGRPDGALNPAPRVLFAVVWGGLLFASLLFGRVWRRLNPLRAVSSGLARLSGDPGEETVRPLPDGLGYWPAAVALAIFVLLEAVAAERPLAVLVYLVAHVVVHVGAASVYGQRWYTRADPFEVYSDLVGRCAVVARRSDGRIGVARPRERVAATPALPGLVVLLATVTAGNLFDGVAASGWWRDLRFGLTGAADAAAAAAGLAVVALVAWLAFRVATGRTPSLAPALVPLAVGYAWAHYFAVVLIETQTALAQLSDPFGLGWNLFGTAGWYATYELLPGTVAALIRLAGFLAGHLGAVVVADAIARRGRSAAAARAVQVPLRAVVTVSVLAGIWLLFGAA